MSYTYTTTADDRINVECRLPKVTKEDGSVVWVHPDTGVEYVTEYELPSVQLVTKTARDALKNRRERLRRSDPLFTTLSDYKPQVEKFRDQHHEAREKAGLKYEPDKIRVFQNQ